MINGISKEEISKAMVEGKLSYQEIMDLLTDVIEERDQLKNQPQTNNMARSKITKLSYNKLDTKVDNDTCLYYGGYISLMKVSQLPIRALFYNRSACELFFSFLSVMDSHNRVTFTKGEMKDFLGVSYNTLDKVIDFLIVNKYVKLIGEESGRRSTSIKRKRIMEFEINHFLTFNGRFTELYGGPKKHKMENMIRAEGRFYEPLSKVLDDGAYQIVIRETGLIERIKKEK